VFRLNPASTLSRILRLLILGALVGVIAPTPAAHARVLRVLTVTGDWKSQPWYQDVWMKGKQLYRGRYIAKRVEEAAPGQFELTDVTNYIGQQYIDSNYLSQFDVLLISDTNGWSMPDRMQAAIARFVADGGGFLYAASWKWHTATLNGTPFEEALPATFAPVGDLTEDWQLADYGTGDKDFKPIVVQAADPFLKGLDW